MTTSPTSPLAQRLRRDAKAINHAADQIDEAIAWADREGICIHEWVILDARLYCEQSSRKVRYCVTCKAIQWDEIW